MPMEMTFIDFFSGIGGFRAGLEACGMRCIGHCEIDKFADQSYRAIFDVKEDEWFAKDITAVSPEEIPRADIWTAGFPCQDISVAGSQRGLNGKRSGLFFEVVRLIQGKNAEDKPQWVILENVKNLLSINRGWDFTTILYTLATLGYDCQYGLLNSRNYGVPQNRERIYIVAYRHSGNKSPGKIFPLTGSDGKTLIQLIGGMQGQRVYSPEGTSVTLSAQSGGWGGKTGLYFIDLNKNSKITDMARCIKTRYNAGITNRGADNSGVYYACARAVLTPNRIEKRQNGPRFKPCGEPSFTLTAQDRHGVMLCDCENCQKRIRIKEATKLGYAEAGCGDSINLAFPNSKTRRGRIGKGVAQTLETGCNQGTAFIGCGRIRRLTPRECWRLQGFTDEMFDKARAINSDNQLYKQAGNSVTVTVVFALGMKILEVKREMVGDDCGR